MPLQFEAKAGPDAANHDQHRRVGFPPTTAIVRNPARNGRQPDVSGQDAAEASVVGTGALEETERTGSPAGSLSDGELKRSATGFLVVVVSR